MEKINQFILLSFNVFLLFLAGCGEKSHSVETTQDNPTTVRTILFLGDSLTAGYGLDPSEAYPALIETKIREADYPYKIENAGISGSTSHDGVNRIEWHMEVNPAVLVLALGANDGLRGIDPTVTKKNLKQIIAKAREANPEIKILLTGMVAPPNMGLLFTRPFNAIYPSLADELEIELVPFLLKDVAGVPKLNLPDGIHPNQLGQQAIAKTVWIHLKEMLDS